MMIVKKVFCEKHMRIFLDMKHILYLLRFMTGCLWKKCFVKNTGGSFLDMKHILLLTWIYDRMFVKKCFVKKHRRDFDIFCINRFYSYLDLSVSDMKCSVLWKNTGGFWNVVFCEKNTGGTLIFFLCKDTQISCINRFYSYSDLSVLWEHMRIFEM